MAGEVGLFSRDFDDSSIIRTLKASSDGVLVTIPYTTQQTHSGRFFFTNFYNATIGAGANFDLLVVTGADTTPHIAVMTDVGGPCTLSIYEGVTASNNGTGLTVINANRQSTKVTTAAAYHTPTITNTGTTLLLNKYIPGGSTGSGPGGGSIGGSQSDFARVTEILLKTSSKYLFRVTNLGAGNIAGSTQLGWFEDV